MNFKRSCVVTNSTRFAGLFTVLFHVRTVIDMVTKFLAFCTIQIPVYTRLSYPLRQIAFLHVTFRILDPVPSAIFPAKQLGRQITEAIMDLVTTPAFRDTAGWRNCPIGPASVHGLCNVEFATGTAPKTIQSHKATESGYITMTVLGPFVALIKTRKAWRVMDIGFVVCFFHEGVTVTLEKQLPVRYTWSKKGSNERVKATVLEEVFLL